MSDWESYKAYLAKSPQTTLKKKHYQYFYFRNRSATWWLTQSRIDVRIKQEIVPNAIEHIVEWKLMTEDEVTNIKAMIASPDEENFIVAMAVIIEHKKTIRQLIKRNKKNKNRRTT